MRTGDWIAVVSGRRWYVTDPHPEDVCIDDIAHALGNVCRFGGHCSEFYSVAQHSLLVSEILSAEFPFDYVLQMHGLMHDATEAYIGDIVRPLKRNMPEYKDLEIRTAEVIYIGLSIPQLPAEQEAILKNADNVALMTEARDLIPGGGEDWSNIEQPWPHAIRPVRPHRVTPLFLQRYTQLKDCIRMRGGEA